jgi:GT2 family glycosyltransferase
MPIKLSIVIPVFNKLAFTKSCLKDLFHLDDESIQIIVVDNASTDDTQKELSIINRRNFLYIRNDKNLFHSSACNTGYKKSSGDNIIFINNDIRVKTNHSNWIDDVILNCNNIVGTSMGQLDDNFNFIKEANTELAGNSYIVGWMIASSRENWHKLADHNNGQVWDERLPFYFNDGDLSFRAKKLGIPIKILSIPVSHFGKISASQQNISKLYADGRKVFLELWKNKK